MSSKYLPGIRTIIKAMIFISAPFLVGAQVSMEVEGKLRIGNADEVQIHDNLVVRTGNGALAIIEKNVSKQQPINLSPGYSEYGFGYQSASFYKLNSRVYIDGLVRKNSGSVSQLDTIFTLPMHYRPRSRIIVHGKQDDKRVRINIEPSGVAWVADPPALSLNWMSLDNIDFFRHEIGNLAARDGSGNVYSSVKIGNQEWLVENLRTSRYNDGTEIPHVIDDNEWTNLTTGGWSWPFHQSALEMPYGKFYNAFAAQNSKICPVGWHVPSLQEWLDLSEYLGGASLALLQLKVKGDVFWHQNATNTRGFSAEYSAQRLEDGVFAISSAATWWTSTAVDINETYGLGMGTFSIFLGFEFDNRAGLPVRCMRQLN